jgi:hypothetical protein
VQRATGLDGSWTTVATLPVPESGVGEWEDTDAPVDQAFYRTLCP